MTVRRRAAELLRETSRALSKGENVFLRFASFYPEVSAPIEIKGLSLLFAEAKLFLSDRQRSPGPFLLAPIPNNTKQNSCFDCTTPATNTTGPNSYALSAFRPLALNVHWQEGQTLFNSEIQVVSQVRHSEQLRIRGRLL